MRRVVFKILVIMVTVFIVVFTCKTWKFRVTHFAIFHDYDHNITVRIICLSVKKHGFLNTHEYVLCENVAKCV
jgi:hypothetical protein